MNINWEMTGVAIASILAIGSLIKWAVSRYMEYILRETKEELDIKGLSKRVADMEVDVKELAKANVVMASTFHIEINKILHKLPGGNHE